MKAAAWREEYAVSHESQERKIDVDALQELSLVVKSFAIDGEFREASILKKGHIHDTFVSTWQAGRLKRRYVHQCINNNVFPNVPLLMNNIRLVLAELKKDLLRTGNPNGEKAISLVSAKNGEPYVQTPSGKFWRTYEYLEGTTSFEVCDSAELAGATARACARFALHLRDLDPGLIGEPIYRFMDAEYRLEQFDAAVQEDRVGRVKECQADIAFVEQKRSVASLLNAGLRDGSLPTRIIHGDTKLNNVLFCEKTNQVLAMVDLDTCMPGTLLFDFGDLVRNSSVRAAEDERDLSKVKVDKEFYTAIVQGYREVFGELLSEGELRLMPQAPKVLALMLGSRFLADHLRGDQYFKIHRPEQNLDRARCQFQIVRALEEVEGELGYLYG